MSDTNDSLTAILTSARKEILSQGILGLRVADVASEVHPYPWLRTPHAGSLKSFSSWRKNLAQGR